MSETNVPALPNAEDQVRQAIADDLPEDEQTRRDWAGVFTLTRALGFLTLLACLGLALWMSIGFDRPWAGVWIALAGLVWGAAAVSVSREGREVALEGDESPPAAEEK